MRAPMDLRLSLQPYEYRTQKAMSYPSIRYRKQCPIQVYDTESNALYEYTIQKAMSYTSIRYRKQCPAMLAQPSILISAAGCLPPFAEMFV